MFNMFYLTYLKTYILWSLEIYTFKNIIYILCMYLYIERYKKGLLGFVSVLVRNTDSKQGLRTFVAIVFQRLLSTCFVI